MFFLLASFPAQKPNVVSPLMSHQAAGRVGQLAGHVTTGSYGRNSRSAALVNTYEQVSPSNVRANFAQRSAAGYGGQQSERAGASARTLRRPRAASPSPAAPAPRYVQRCGCDALWTWERNSPVVLQRRPLLCGSWRHEGPCARYRASVDFARIKEAVERPEYQPTGWVFCVLTLDRDGYYGGEPWLDTQQAYRSLSRMSRNFLTALRKSCKKNGWTSPGSSWVAVVEAHRSGWPHVNLLFYCPELAAEIEAERLNERANGASARDATLIFGEVARCATMAGWGPQSTAERARSRDALAGYFVKLAGQAGHTTGELAKLTQVPVQAKAGFRRLRSGVGFLPPKRKNEAYTGTLLRRELNPQRSAFAAVPLVMIRDPEARRISELCLPLEEDRIAREFRAHLLSQKTGLPLKHFAPARVESFRIRDGTYVLSG